MQEPARCRRALRNSNSADELKTGERASRDTGAGMLHPMCSTGLRPKMKQPDPGRNPMPICAAVTTGCVFAMLIVPLFSDLAAPSDQISRSLLRIVAIDNAERSVGLVQVALLAFFVRPFEHRPAFLFREFPIDRAIGRQLVVVEFHKLFVRVSLRLRRCWPLRHLA
jgi:hypothetical protein